MNGDPDPQLHMLVYVNTVPYVLIMFNIIVQASLSGGPLYAPYEWRGLAGSQRCSRSEKRSNFFFTFLHIFHLLSLLQFMFSLQHLFTLPVRCTNTWSCPPFLLLILSVFKVFQKCCGYSFGAFRLLSSRGFLVLVAMFSFLASCERFSSRPAFAREGYSWSSVNFADLIEETAATCLLHALGRLQLNLKYSYRICSQSC